MDYFLKLFPTLVKATGNTLLIFAVTLVFSLPLGWLLSLLRVGKNKAVAKVIEIYCWIMRGTPLLLQMTFIYFGLPFIGKGLTLSNYQAAFLAYVLNYAAYFAEIFRGGIESIGKGQYEAADVLGLSRSQVMSRIIMPQAIKTVLPSIGNEVITLIKDTSLVYTISIVELLRTAQIAATRDFRIEGFVGAAIIYLMLTWVATKLQSWVERRFAYYR